MESSHYVMDLHYAVAMVGRKTILLCLLLLSSMFKRNTPTVLTIL